MPAKRASAQATAKRNRLRSLNFLSALGLASCMAVAAAAAWVIWEQRLAAINSAGTNLQHLSLAMADQTDRVIASVERAENRLIDHMTGGQDGTMGQPPEAEQLHVAMRDMVSATPEAYGFLLTDENGYLLNSSIQWPTLRLNFADRAYFQFAHAHPAIESFVSEVVISRQSGRPTFNIVRRLSGPDGAFKGVLLGSIQIDYLRRLFAASTLTNGGTVALFQLDGTLLVRHPTVPVEMQRHEAEFHASSLGTTRTAIRHIDATDGVERLIALNTLPHHPLTIAVSEPLSAALAAWRVEAAWIGGLAVLGCLATAVTIFLAIRRINDQRRLEAAAFAYKVDEERKRAESEIKEQHVRFGMALDNMRQGLLMFDRSNRLLLANAAVLKMFELPSGRLQPGMPVVDVIRAVAEVGNISEHVTAVIDFYLKVVQHDIPTTFLRKLPDGRQLAANFAPYHNGWLITYEDMTESRKADERITYMALHDALTGLPNRVMLRTSTEGAFAETHGSGGKFAIACLDLDHFKDVNDTLGHSAGDKLLCEVAKRIQSVTRQSDIVARLGGDEFAIVVTSTDGRAAIASMATRLVETIGAPYEIDGQMVFIGVSIGVAVAPEDGPDAGTLMKSADLALYRAKGEGRGRFVFFEPSMEQHAVERRRIERELHEALSLGEFQMHYQPLVEVASRRIVGFEALIRWCHSSRGMIYPGEFIPISEENGFIIHIAEWALNKACLEAVRWPGHLKLAVNLSPVQFRSGKLVQTVAAALEASGLAANRLELEITESTMMNDTDATIATLTELKDLGVRIAMDDFGTGYSSLAYLKKFPFDKIKIDRAFVHDIGQPTNLAIIRAVTDIAETMGIMTTAEGVETEEQFALVEGARCNEAQGYLFSPACPQADILPMLARENTLAVNGGQRGLDRVAA